MLQSELVKHFGKDPLLLVAGLVDFVRDVSWFGASPLAQGLLCSYGAGPHPASPLIRVLGIAMPVTKWSPHRMWLPATPVESSRNSK